MTEGAILAAKKNIGQLGLASIDHTVKKDEGISKEQCERLYNAVHWYLTFNSKNGKNSKIYLNQDNNSEESTRWQLRNEKESLGKNNIGAITNAIIKEHDAYLKCRHVNVQTMEEYREKIKGD